jgi:t-SNARE complex subunit (syntaxin)
MLTRERKKSSTHQIQTQLQIDVDVQNEIIAERDNAIAVIQNDMVAVHDAFQQMAILVEQQGDMVDNIQNNVQQAFENVEKGKNEIEKAHESQKSTCVLL